MLQHTDTDTSLSSHKPGTEVETEADHSNSEVFGYVSNDPDRPTPHKRALAHGGITAHYPRQADLSTSTSGLASSTSKPPDAFENTMIGSELRQVLDVPCAPRTKEYPARANTIAGHEPSEASISNSVLSTFMPRESLSTLSYSILQIFTFGPVDYTILPTTSVAPTTSTTVLTSTLSSLQSGTNYGTINSPLLSQLTTEYKIESYPTLSSTHEQMTSRGLTAISESHTAASGSHPVTSRSQTPSLGIIAGSAVGGTAVLAVVVLTSLCFMRRRARRRNRYDGNKRVHSDSNSRSSSQANFEINHENEALDVTPVDHDGEIISTAAAPLSTTATVPSVPAPIILPTNLPTSSPGVPIPIAPENSSLDLGSNSNPNLHQEPYQYLQRNLHSDWCSEHEVYTPCPSYSCISLRENNCTIGPTSPQWYGREGRGRWSDGEGGRGTTRGRGRSRSRSRSRPIARRTNIPSRSTAGSEAVSRAGTWMTASERSTETAPPSYDHANQ